MKILQFCVYIILIRHLNREITAFPLQLLQHVSEASEKEINFGVCSQFKGFKLSGTSEP